MGEKYIINGDEKRLPGELNNVIRECIQKVYFEEGASKYGLEMSADDLDDAYRLWLMWFRKSTNALDLPKPEPYSFGAEMEEVWDTFVDNLSDLGTSISDGLSGSGGILGVLSVKAILFIQLRLLQTWKATNALGQQNRITTWIKHSIWWGQLVLAEKDMRC